MGGSSSKIRKFRSRVIKKNAASARNRPGSSANQRDSALGLEHDANYSEIWRERLVHRISANQNPRTRLSNLKRNFDVYETNKKQLADTNYSEDLLAEKNNNPLIRVGETTVKTSVY